LLRAAGCMALPFKLGCAPNAMGIRVTMPPINGITVDDLVRTSMSPFVWIPHLHDACFRMNIHRPTTIDVMMQHAIV
jgi:hypothetical protein